MGASSGLFGFLGAGKGEGEMTISDLAAVISTALEKSDSKVTTRLDEFSRRMDAFESRMHLIAERGNNLRASCVDSLTLAERDALAKQASQPLQPAAATAAAPATSTTLVSLPLAGGTMPSAAPPPSSDVSAAAQVSSRERYLAKFEKAEIFGKSQDELEKEQHETAARMRLKQGGGGISRRFMLMPGSGIRLTWDFISVLLVFYVSIALPYQVAFLMDYTDSSRAIIDFIIDCFFIADIFINFRTAILTDGELVANPYAVAREYMRLWFWLDLASSIPFDWFIGGLDLTTNEVVTYDGNSSDTDGGTQAAQLVNILRVLKVIKLLRLLRVVRLFRYVSRWEQTFVVISSTTLRMLKLVVILLMFSHWNGCFQFMLSALQRQDGEFYVDSWVYRAQFHDASPPEQWAWSFFHAASQLLAISPGLVLPGTGTEICVYLISMLTGATLYAVFVATVTAFFADADPSAREYRSKLDMVNQYMRHAQLPHSLRLKLRTYYQLKFPGHRAFDEERILKELSAPLTHEVRLQKCRDVLTALNIIEAEDPAVAYYLCDKLQRVVFVAGDFVIREGQEAAGMYFISAGLVEVVSSHSPDEVITTLGAQSFFGEMSLLNPTGETTASIVVRTYLEGYLLTRQDYVWLERHHPIFRDYLASAARLRLVRMQERLRDKVNDNEKLHALYDVIDPVKRRLVRKHNWHHEKVRHAAHAAHAAHKLRPHHGHGPAEGGAPATSTPRHGFVASALDMVRSASGVITPNRRPSQPPSHPHTPESRHTVACSSTTSSSDAHADEKNERQSQGSRAANRPPIMRPAKANEGHDDPTTVTV